MFLRTFHHVSSMWLHLHDMKRLSLISHGPNQHPSGRVLLFLPLCPLCFPLSDWNPQREEGRCELEWAALSAQENTNWMFSCSRLTGAETTWLREDEGTWICSQKVSKWRGGVKTLWPSDSVSLLGHLGLAFNLWQSTASLAAGPVFSMSIQSSSCEIISDATEPVGNPDYRRERMWFDLMKWSGLSVTLVGL